MNKNSWANGKPLGYILFALAIVVVLANVLGFIPEAVMLPVIGLLGFGGLGAIRAYINSTGKKTYIMIGLGVLGIVVSQLQPELMTPEKLKQWLTIIGALGGTQTLAGIVKAQE